MTTQEKLQSGKRLTKDDLAYDISRSAPAHSRMPFILLMELTRAELVDKYNTLFQANIK